MVLLLPKKSEKKFNFWSHTIKKKNYIVDMFIKLD